MDPPRRRGPGRSSAAGKPGVSFLRPGRGKAPTEQPVSPEDVLMRSLREAPHGLTLNECWTVLRPFVGRTRLREAVKAVRESPEVSESVETRPNRSQRPETQRVLRISSTQSVETTTLPPVRPVPRPARPALLVVTQGPISTKQFTLRADRNTVGRHPRSGIVLNDVTVSRLHAELDYDDGRFRLRDRESRNGTYVNDVRVEEKLLTPGDQVDIGAFRLMFLTPSAPGDTVA